MGSNPGRPLSGSQSNERFGAVGGASTCLPAARQAYLCSSSFLPSSWKSSRASMILSACAEKHGCHRKPHKLKRWRRTKATRTHSFDRLDGLLAGWCSFSWSLSGNLQTQKRGLRGQPDVRQRPLVRALTTGMSPLDMLSSNSASRSCQTRRTVSKELPAARPRPPHHLALLLQDDGLPGSLPQPQGLVVGRRHQVVPAGADGQTPDLPMVTLRGRFFHPKFHPELCFHVSKRISCFGRNSLQLRRQRSCFTWPCDPRL